MAHTVSRLVIAGALAGILAVPGCRARPSENAAPNPRPVRVAALRVIDPARSLRLTGSVASWKEQDVSFELPGRVAFIVDGTTNLEGRWEEDGRIRVEGDVLARLDPRTYQIARAVAGANLAVAERELATARVQLTRVLPAQVQATAAELERATVEYEMNLKAFETAAVSERDVIRTRSARDASRARNEEAKAQIEAQEAEIEARKASVERARQDLAAAEYDLARCTLHAPFDAEVSEVKVEAGGYVQAGQAVAHLVMMDPIKVDLALSESVMRRLRRGDGVQVYTPGLAEMPIRATVYEKATVADPATRTFRVSLLTRNVRDLDLPPGSPLRRLPRIEDFTYLQLAQADEPEQGYYVEERRSLREDENGYFVWAAPAVKLGDRIDPERPVVRLRKGYVKPGERRRNLQGIFLGRALEDIGKLEPATLIAMDVPADFPDGAEAVLARRRWRFRPGQLVRVLFAADRAEPGLYVPPSAVRADGEGRGRVFLLVDGRARQAAVRLAGSAGESIRIEPADEAAESLVTPGSRLILDSIHFLEDGELVRAVREEELSS